MATFRDKRKRNRKSPEQAGGQGCPALWPGCRASLGRCGRQPSSWLLERSPPIAGPHPQIPDTQPGLVHAAPRTAQLCDGGASAGRPPRLPGVSASSVPHRWLPPLPSVMLLCPFPVTSSSHEKDVSGVSWAWHFRVTPSCVEGRAVSQGDLRAHSPLVPLLDEAHVPARGVPALVSAPPGLKLPCQLGDLCRAFGTHEPICEMGH